MSVTNINCIIATSITIMVTKVVAKGNIFNTVDIFLQTYYGKVV